LTGTRIILPLGPSSLAYPSDSSGRDHSQYQAAMQCGDFGHGGRPANSSGAADDTRAREADSCGFSADSGGNPLYGMLGSGQMGN